jgi:hypothetical protein
MISKEASQFMVQVTKAGRGFVVQGTPDKYVVTAAHCAPWVPEARPADIGERTYRGVIGPLGTEEPKIWAECLFIDPVSDIAVLGPPDEETVYGQWEAYGEFTEQRVPLSMRRADDLEEACFLALDEQRCFRCKIHAAKSGLWITDAEEPLLGGMSGSPILGGDDKVIGVFCRSTGAAANRENHREGGPNPGLANLPGWLLEELSPRGRPGRRNRPRKAQEPPESL